MKLSRVTWIITVIAYLMTMACADSGKGPGTTVTFYKGKGGVADNSETTDPTWNLKTNAKPTALVFTILQEINSEKEDLSYVASPTYLSDLMANNTDNKGKSCYSHKSPIGKISFQINLNNCIWHSRSQDARFNFIISGTQTYCFAGDPDATCLRNVQSAPQYLLVTSNLSVVGINKKVPTRSINLNIKQTLNVNSNSKDQSGKLIDPCQGQTCSYDVMAHSTYSPSATQTAQSTSLVEVSAPAAINAPSAMTANNLRNSTATNNSSYRLRRVVRPGPTPTGHDTSYDFDIYDRIAITNSSANHEPVGAQVRLYGNGLNLSVSSSSNSQAQTYEYTMTDDSQDITFAYDPNSCTTMDQVQSGNLTPVSSNEDQIVFSKTGIQIGSDQVNWKLDCQAVAGTAPAQQTKKN